MLDLPSTHHWTLKEKIPLRQGRFIFGSVCLFFTRITETLQAQLNETWWSVEPGRRNNNILLRERSSGRGGGRLSSRSALLVFIMTHLLSRRWWKKPGKKTKCDFIFMVCSSQGLLHRIIRVTIHVYLKCSHFTYWQFIISTNALCLP